MTEDKLATQAAFESKLSAQEKQIIEAWLACGDMSPATVAQQLGMAPAAVLDVLKRAEVRRAIGFGMLTETKDQHKAAKNHVLMALLQLAHWDIKDIFDAEGKALPIQQWPASMRAAVKGWKQGKYGPEYTFVDRAQIFQTLLQYFTKYANKNEDGAEADDRTVLVVHAEEEEEV